MSRDFRVSPSGRGRYSPATAALACTPSEDAALHSSLSLQPSARIDPLCVAAATSFESTTRRTSPSSAASGLARAASHRCCVMYSIAALPRAWAKAHPALPSTLRSISVVNSSQFMLLSVRRRISSFWLSSSSPASSGVPTSTCPASQSTAMVLCSTATRRCHRSRTASTSVVPKSQCDPQPDCMRHVPRLPPDIPSPAEASRHCSSSSTPSASLTDRPRPPPRLSSLTRLSLSVFAEESGWS